MKQLWLKLQQALTPWLVVGGAAYREWLNKELDKSADEFDGYLKRAQRRARAELKRQEAEAAIAFLDEICRLKLSGRFTPSWLLEQARDPAPTLERCQNPGFLVTAYLAPSYRRK